MTSTPAAGWYPDPTDQTRMRWWDGTVWTEQVHQMPAATPAAQLLPPPSGDAVLLPGTGQSTTTATKKKLPLWAWIVIGVVGLGVGIMLSPIFTVLWLVVLITGIVALVKSTPTWLRFSSRKVATIVTAISAVCFLLTGSVANAVIGDTSSKPLSLPMSSPAPEASASAAPNTTPSAAPMLSAEDAEPVPFAGDASTIADTSSTEGTTALQVLATLPVKGRAAKSGYSRDQFGQRWLDVDRNGCDTRNDILARDLTAIQRSGTCKVVTGVLADPYTAQSISFVRGQGTSELVQIDHVVALSDAWQKGAQQLNADQRATFANDPLNLLAVDGSANAQKSDGDAATWLPKNKDFRCAYVARQVAVKATYGLWVTQAEHDTIARVLSACPDETLLTSSFARVAPAPVEEEPTPVKAQPAPAPTTPVPLAPAPAPVQKAPVQKAPAQKAPAQKAPAQKAPAQKAPPTNVSYANCTAVRAAGKAPIHAGDPGYTRKLDRDGDGVACE